MVQCFQKLRYYKRNFLKDTGVSKYVSVRQLRYKNSRQKIKTFYVSSKIRDWECYSMQVRGLKKLIFDPLLLKNYNENIGCFAAELVNIAFFVPTKSSFVMTFYYNVEAREQSFEKGKFRSSTEGFTRVFKKYIHQVITEKYFFCANFLLHKGRKQFIPKIWNYKN